MKSLAYDGDAAIAYDTGATTQFALGLRRDVSTTSTVAAANAPDA
jgi:hypothetical protein